MHRGGGFVIRIRVEFSDPGGNRSSLEVEAQNIEQALEQVSAIYPGREVRVVFPIDPEGFFVGGAPVAAIEAQEAWQRTTALVTTMMRQGKERHQYR
jgi:hypothetical protein